MSKRLFLACVATSLILPASLMAQDAATVPADDAMTVATAAGVCEFGVETAVYTAPLEITATCLEEDEATAFVPLLGGAAPAILPGLAFLAAVAGGGDGSTVATSGTD